MKKTNCFNCLPSIVAADFLRETGTNHWEVPNSTANDLFNFKGLGAGYCNIDPNNSHFLGLLHETYWWSNTSNASTANAVEIGVDPYLFLWGHNKTFGFSVRCIKDPIPVSLTNGLIAYYPFNGNANDESGNGNNGTVNGATLTTDRFGYANKAYSFNSNYSGHYSGNDFIRCLYPGPLGNSSRTFSFWIKTNVSNISSLNNTVISYGSNNINGKEFRIVFGNDCGNGGMVVHNLSFNQQINYTPNDLWDYFTVVFNNSLGNNVQGISIYKNGSLVQNYCTTTNGIDVNTGSDSPITFGRYHYLDWLPDAGFFKGSLDDIRIYNRALTQEEITYLATH